MLRKTSHINQSGEGLKTGPIPFPAPLIQIDGSNWKEQQTRKRKKPDVNASRMVTQNLAYYYQLLLETSEVQRREIDDCSLKDAQGIPSIADDVTQSMIAGTEITIH
ncbi:hypothetical protein TNCV_2816461 [Trichonephila clavipes]|nr:hypothetical protein TNCV_2816461 [Trichonephila clavipes]